MDNYDDSEGYYTSSWMDKLTGNSCSSLHVAWLLTMLCWRVACSPLLQPYLACHNPLVTPKHLPAPPPPLPPCAGWRAAGQSLRGVCLQRQGHVQHSDRLTCHNPLCDTHLSFPPPPPALLCRLVSCWTAAMRCLRVRARACSAQCCVHVTSSSWCPTPSQAQRNLLRWPSRCVCVFLGGGMVCVWGGGGLGGGGRAVSVELVPRPWTDGGAWVEVCVPAAAVCGDCCLWGL
jgi:hypothetical protein